MSINLMEGGRRIALAISILAFVTSLAMTLGTLSYPKVFYNVDSYSADPIASSACTSDYFDYSHGVSQTQAGFNYEMHLCFKTQSSPDGTRKGIPYAEKENGGGVMYIEPERIEASKYMDLYRAAMILFKEDKLPTNWQVAVLNIPGIVRGIGISILVFISFMAFFRVIGWITRGFLKA